MKNTIILSLSLMLALPFFNSCGGGSGGKEVYQCPMKCEGEKTYDKPGKCPVCGMKLEKVEHQHMHADSTETK